MAVVVVAAGAVVVSCAVVVWWTVVPGVAVADQFHPEEQAATSHITDDLVP